LWEHFVAHDVFISYSSKDKPAADAACAVLESKGIRCWIAPRDIIPGTDWGESIIDALTQSRAFVLVFSSHANSSPQIKREVERAVNHGLPVIPLRIEDVAPIKSLEYFISSPHWLDAFSPPLERHLNYLADILSHILEKKELPARLVEPTRPAEPARGIVGRFRYALIGVSLAIVLAGATVAIWKFHTPESSDKALTAGDAAAWTNLGNQFFNGNGVPVDYAEARKWYEKAAAAGNEVAKANLKKLEGSNLK